MLGYAALLAFAVFYVGVLAWGRTMRHAWRVSAPLSHRWGAVGVLAVLGLLTVPAAGPHGLATMVYVSATAMMLLPLRWAWTLVAVLMVGVESSAFLVRRVAQRGLRRRPRASCWPRSRSWGCDWPRTATPSC